MQNKIPFGVRVRVKATLIRMRDGNRRYWQKFDDTDFEAIFLGYRTLYDGKSEWHTSHSMFEPEPDTYWAFTIEKTHKGALVCRKGFNPIKVFLEDIELIGICEHGNSVPDPDCGCGT